MDPLEKKVRISGYSFAIRACTRSMYSKLLSLCGSFKATWTVAVYGPEFVVYSDEKSGTTPMFATILFRSFGSTACRIRPSTLATYCSVTSMRVPVGTFMLMVNWPASVRGKNAKPSKG